MEKKEFSKTKTVISPDGKTVTTMTVSGMTRTTGNSSTVFTSFYTGSTATFTSSTSIITKNGEIKDDNSE